MCKWLLLILVLTGCGQTSRGGGDTKFLLPWRDVNGKYELEEVTIETLASPTELRGEAAEVYSQAAFSADGFKNSIARPRVTKSGDVYIPLDAESSIAIAVYAQFDRLFKYEKQIGSRAQLSWPRKVGIELNMTGPGASTHNNAHYFTVLDAIGLMPYTQEGVPVALNHGIVAHEHFHAHFQAQVMNVLNQGPEILVSNLENLFYPFFSFKRSTTDNKLDTRTPRGLNNLILRAWNEGLADLFAGLYTGQSEFFKPSIPQLANARDLDMDGGQMLSADQLREFTSASPRSNEQMTGLAYAQGTSLARLLYHLANTGPESPQVFQARILRQIGKIPAKIAAGISTKVMDFDDVVPVLLEDYPLNPDVCAALNGALMKSTLQRSFASCGF